MSELRVTSKTQYVRYSIVTTTTTTFTAAGLTTHRLIHGLAPPWPPHRLPLLLFTYRFHDHANSACRVFSRNPVQTPPRHRPPRLI